MLIYHLFALLSGMLLDLIIGDPHGIWHPIVFIGKWIAVLDRRLINDSDRNSSKEKARGYILVLLVVIPVVVITGGIVVASYYLNIYAGLIVEAILTCYCLCTRSLIVESGKVVTDYNEQGIEKARSSLSMIVGRDTKNLDIKGVLRAAIETVAENSSDGFVAPFMYLLLGGPILGLLYKAINTMDSMVGYKNDRYEYFGFAAAKLDDIANFIPSRISGLLAVAASFSFCGFNRKNAFAIFKRDRLNHKSPNSAQSESAFAGALSLRLGGPSYYFGKLVDKPYIGDDIKEIDIDDLFKAHKLLIFMEIICIIFVLLLLSTLFILKRGF